MRNFLQGFKGDRVIWVLMVFLTIYSGLAVSSSVAALAFHNGGNVTSHIVRHIMVLAIGWVVLYTFHRLPFRIYNSGANLILVAAGVLLFLTLIFGVHVNDATRSLKIPVFGTFQTSDFAKIALIIFVARFLSRNQTEIQNFKKGFLPVIAFIGVICGLIAPENLSTAAILFLTTMVMLFIGRTKLIYLVGLAGAGILLLGFIIMIGKTTSTSGREQTWQNRITQHFSKDDNPEEKFQSDKAKIAIANGGMFGKFAGHSTQRRSLPQAYSDFIFAIVIEEYGFLFGALPLMFIYLILLYRAGVIVRKCTRSFPAFLVVGLTVGLVIQAMVNMGVSSGLLPVTGQPLPWVSRGGTSIIFTAVAIGMILGVSRSIEEEVPVAEE
jgi:cell division protein FtsW